MQIPYDIIMRRGGVAALRDAHYVARKAYIDDMLRHLAAYVENGTELLCPVVARGRHDTLTADVTLNGKARFANVQPNPRSKKTRRTLEIRCTTSIGEEWLPVEAFENVDLQVVILEQIIDAN